mmetsp:Transcript_7500/g.17488  ORF Transcript_7500/g.17488 Transcript_7500/m.17488 type:complete len:275 (+) Transcript_7500:1050-1874(+)
MCERPDSPHETSRHASPTVRNLYSYILSSFRYNQPYRRQSWRVMQPTIIAVILLLNVGTHKIVSHGCPAAILEKLSDHISQMMRDVSESILGIWRAVNYFDVGTDPIRVPTQLCNPRNRPLNLLHRIAVFLYSTTAFVFAFIVIAGLSLALIVQQLKPSLSLKLLFVQRVRILVIARQYVVLNQETKTDACREKSIQGFLHLSKPLPIYRSPATVLEGLQPPCYGHRNRMPIQDNGFENLSEFSFRFGIHRHGKVEYHFQVPNVCVGDRLHISG